MKIRNFIISISLITLLSCNDNIENIGSSDAKVLTRAIVDGNNASISNPDLFDNWENVEKIYLNTIGTDTKNKYVNAPWANSGVSSSLSEIFRKDIKKEDGWKMLVHTFSNIGSDEHQNYICFYNLFTGFIKVFYFYEGGNNNQNSQWSIKTSNKQHVKMLDKPSYFTKPMSDLAENNELIISNMAQNEANGMSPGWNGFEFQVPRYCDDLKDMDFTIDATDEIITMHDFSGKFDSSTTGTITTKSNRDSKLGSFIGSAIGNVAGNGVKPYIDSLAEDHFKEKKILGKKIVSLIGSISTGSYASAIKAGINLIFGKTTTTTTSEVKLTTTGTVTIEGRSTSIQTSGITPLSFNLYSVLNSTNNQAETQSTNTETTTHHLGVWTLKKKPVVYYNRVTHLFNVKRDNTYTSSNKVKITGDTYLPNIRCDYEPIINPDIEPYITKKNFSVQFVVCDKMDGKPYNDNMNDINDNLGKEILYSDSTRSISSSYETGKLKHFDIIVPKLKNNMLGTYYYDWGNVTNGRLLAVVTLDMTYNYNGAQKEVSSSQVYEVDYGVDETQLQPESVQNLPNSAVINYGYPFYTERKNVNAANDVNALSDEDEEPLYKLHLLPE